MLPKVVGEHSHPNCRVGGLTEREKKKILTACPAFTGIKWKCTQQVVKPPLSPVQYKQGEEGGFYLNWLVRGCFVAKKRCPGELFARKIGRERTNKRVSPVPLPEFEEFSSR